MAQQWRAKFVKCPYYHRHENNKICCEGLSGGNTIHLVYEDEKERRKYMEEYCESIKWCRLCPIHRLLDDKYEEDD